MLRLITTLKEKYKIAGIYFLIIQLLIIIELFLFSGANGSNEWIGILFFCYHGPLILSIGFFTKNIELVKTIISVLLIVQLLWIADFLLYGFVGFNFMGITKDIYGYGIIIYMIYVTVHLASSIVALMFTWNERNSPISLVYGMIYAFCIYLLVILLSNKHNDINCIYNGCGTFITFVPHFTLIWPILFFIFCIVPGYMIQVAIYICFQEKQY